MDKVLNQAIGMIANPRREIEKTQRAELRNFRVSLTGAEKFAEAEIPKLEELNLNDIAPLVSRIEEANIHDLELARMLFDLRELTKKPSELRGHLEQLRATNWQGISSPPFHEQVDQRKRDGLARHFVRVLSKFGDHRGAVRSLIERINQRIIMLAENARRDGAASSIRISVPPGDRPDKLTVIVNLPHD